MSFSTQPLPLSMFWPLLSEWAQSRLHPGLPWLPNGWSQALPDDFVAFTLNKSIASRQQTPHHTSSHLAYDLETRVPALLGADKPVGLTMNRHHAQAKPWFIEMEAQGFHDHPESFRHRLSAHRERFMHHANAPGAPHAHGAVIAIVLDPDTMRDLQQHHGYHHQFSSKPPSGTGGQDFHVLSCSVDRSAHHTLGR